MSGESQLPARTRAETCLSDLALDRYRLDEVNGDNRAAIEAHLAGCAVCHGRLDALSSDAVAFRRVPWMNEAIRGSRARAAARMSPWIAGVVAAAAAVIVAVVLVRSPSTTMETTRTKGGLDLSLIVRRGGAGDVEQLLPGDPVRPGDALRFRLTSERDGYVVIAALDAGGRVSVYYPPADVSAHVGKGKDVLLEGAITADPTLGPERILAVACDAPIAVDTVVARAEEALDRAGRDPKKVVALELGCRESSVLVDKVQPK